MSLSHGLNKGSRL